MNTAKVKIDIAKRQVEKVQKDFKCYVSNFSDMGISDYEYSDDRLRVFVDFDFCLREVDIKKIEILDDNYEEIHSDNALALRRFIKQEIADYNKEEENRDQKEADELAHRNYVMFGLYY